MRPSVRCAQPAEGRARGEESWQRIRGARRRSPRAASPESHLSPGASVASKSVSVTHNRFPWAAEDAAGPRGARGRLTSYFQEPLADRVGCLADRCLLLGGYGSEVAGRGLSNVETFFLLPQVPSSVQYLRRLLCRKRWKEERKRNILPIAFLIPALLCFPFSPSSKGSFPPKCLAKQKRCCCFCMKNKSLIY
uniref:Uncharacterized protein n=1 Tax=Neovison vison TaxID=452646 RepID=A0A8C7B4V6_NEOVI